VVAGSCRQPQTYVLTLITFGVDYELRNSLQSFLHSPVSASLLDHEYLPQHPIYKLTQLMFFLVWCLSLGYLTTLYIAEIMQCRING